METGIGKNFTTTLIITFVKAPLLNISSISKSYSQKRSLRDQKNITGNDEVFFIKSMNRNQEFSDGSYFHVPKTLKPLQPLLFYCFFLFFLSESPCYVR